MTQQKDFSIDLIPEKVDKSTLVRQYLTDNNLGNIVYYPFNDSSFSKYKVFESRGIYLITDVEKFIYVGRTKKFCSRLRTHHYPIRRYEFFKDFDYINRFEKQLKLPPISYSKALQSKTIRFYYLLEEYKKIKENKFVIYFQEELKNCKVLACYVGLLDLPTLNNSDISHHETNLIKLLQPTLNIKSK